MAALAALALGGCVAAFGAGPVSPAAAEAQAAPADTASSIVVKGVTSSYLAAPRPARDPQAAVKVTTGPPAQGAALLSISRCQCWNDCSGCLELLREQARRFGGNCVYGVHTKGADDEDSPTSLVGTLAFDPSAPPAAAPQGFSTRFEWQPKASLPALDVVLQRAEAPLVLQDSTVLTSWRRLCKLPCTADVDQSSRYRLTAAGLADLPPLELKQPLSEEVRVTTRSVRRYDRVWWGVGYLGFAAALAGGGGAYCAVSGSCSTVAWTVGSVVLVAAVAEAIVQFLAGPYDEVHLAVDR
ncbi:MAG: hypothetical protein ACYDCL_01420 [Myxococcales bacterium]